MHASFAYLKSVVFGLQARGFIWIVFSYFAIIKQLSNVRKCTVKSCFQVGCWCRIFVAETLVLWAGSASRSGFWQCGSATISEFFSNCKTYWTREWWITEIYSWLFNHPCLHILKASFNDELLIQLSQGLRFVLSLTLHCDWKCI